MEASSRNVATDRRESRLRTLRTHTVSPRCAIEGDIAPKNLTLRHRSQRCANVTFFGARLTSTAQGGATLSRCKVLWRNVTLRCAIEGYFAPKKITLAQSFPTLRHGRLRCAK